MTGAASGIASGGRNLFIGLMSGTSIDGVDGVLARFDEGGRLDATLARVSLPMPEPLRRVLTHLQSPGPNELATAADAAVALADLYADCVAALLARAKVRAGDVVALAAHGQTVRHEPGRGWTLQILNPNRLAERTGIATVSDLRGADIAAGGQGAPLVPVFHARVFTRNGVRRGIVNIGGIANLTVLPDPDATPAGTPAEPVIGFDTGPGNTLMDAWSERHRGTRFDAGGAWAATGRIDEALLARLLQAPYFGLPPPKSTGRDLFNTDWLAGFGVDAIAPADVQATLLALTVRTIADAARAHRVQSVHVCGGGSSNATLMKQLAAALPGLPVASTTALGLEPQAVEATAFAWLARQRIAGEAGNLPSVTGAAALRVLGALTLPPPAG